MRVKGTRKNMLSNYSVNALHGHVLVVRISNNYFSNLLNIADANRKEKYLRLSLVTQLMKCGINTKIILLLTPC